VFRAKTFGSRTLQGLHLELHPRNDTTKRREWRVKSKEDEEFISSPTQGEEVVQGVAAASKVNLTNEVSSCLMEAGESGERAQSWVDISFIARWLKNDS